MEKKNFVAAMGINLMPDCTSKIWQKCFYVYKTQLRKKFILFILSLPLVGPEMFENHKE